MSSLRPYQEECQKALLADLSNGSRSALYVLPTGTGKTQIALATMADWPDQQCGVLGIAHREELVWQPWERWKQMYGEYPEMEMAEYRRKRGGSRLTFASKDSLHPSRLKEAFPDPKSIGLLWVDEAHHCVRANQSYSHILDYFLGANPDCRLFGSTATPDRADEAALGESFDTVSFDFPLFDPDGGPSAIGDGWLVPIDQQYVEVSDLHFDNVGSRGGDFIDSQLERMLLEDKGLYKITSETKTISAGKLTLCFVPGIDSAITQCNILNAEISGWAYTIASRVPAEHLENEHVVNSGDKDRRRSLLKRWARGEFQFLSNVGVLTEGFDEPLIGCISMGRPTKSRALYSQCVGRGTRVLPGVIEGPDWRIESREERLNAIANSGKSCILVLDFVGNSRHPLISSLDILGGRYSDEVVEKAKANVKKSGSAISSQQALSEAAAQVEEEKRQQLRKSVRAKTRSTIVKIDPFSILELSPAVREPGWHKGRKPTPKQLDTLRKFKIPEKELSGISFWQATKLLDKLIQRAKDGKCTYKQATLLAKYGQPTDVGFSQASKIIDAIASNGWRPIPVTASTDRAAPF